MKIDKNSLEPLFLIFFSIFVFVAGIEIAALSPLIIVTAPAVFMVMERRHGVRVSLLCVALGSALVMAGLGAGVAFIYMFAMGILGVTFGVLSGRFKSGAEFLLASISASVAVKVFLLVIFYGATGVNLLALTPERALNIAANISYFLSRGGISIPPDSVSEYAREIELVLAQRAPSMLIIFSSIDTFASYVAGAMALKKFGGGRIPVIPKFAYWKFPKNIFLAVIAAVILDAIGRAGSGNDTFSMVASNILELLYWLFLIEGLALAWYYMTARHMNRFFKIPAVLFCCLISPLSFIMSCVGFADIWFDLRRYVGGK